jgi:diguanylate cyclase (GGDEF)-like protein
LRDHAVSSIIGVPLMDGSRHFGILCMLLNGDGKKFNAHDLSLADSIGHQINIDILNARLFKDIQRLAITDPLTGWYNRRHIFELAQNELERSQRYDHPMAVIMLDIDWFKQINDTHGHLVGDQVLQAIARRIEKNLRKPDIGGRYGGEEFIILLPETGIIAAQQAAERIRVTVSNQPIATTKGVIPVTISLGVSGIQGGHGLIAEKLMDMADQAMYAAKRAGRDRVAVWREGGIHEILPLSRS